MPRTIAAQNISPNKPRTRIPGIYVILYFKISCSPVTGYWGELREAFDSAVLIKMLSAALEA